MKGKDHDNEGAFLDREKREPIVVVALREPPPMGAVGQRITHGNQRKVCVYKSGVANQRVQHWHEVEE